MVDRLAETKAIFSQAETFSELIELLAPSSIFDCEALLSGKKTGDLLDALKNTGIIYRRRGKYSIRMALYPKLFWLQEMDDIQQCEEILSINPEE